MMKIWEGEPLLLIHNGGSIESMEIKSIIKTKYRVVIAVIEGKVNLN
jgi:hypothetical protein